MPTTYAYVRAALGPGAAARLAQEADRYGTVPSYAAHFRRQGLPALQTGIVVNTEKELKSALDAWDGMVDEVVVRAITASDSLDETMALVQAASPLP
jgi:hypothetical protein